MAEVCRNEPFPSRLVSRRNPAMNRDIDRDEYITSPCCVSNIGALPVGDFNAMDCSIPFVSTVTGIPVNSAAMSGAKAKKDPEGE